MYEEQLAISTFGSAENFSSVEKERSSKRPRMRKYFEIGPRAIVSVAIRYPPFQAYIQFALNFPERYNSLGEVTTGYDKDTRSHTAPDQRLT